MNVICQSPVSVSSVICHAVICVKYSSLRIHSSSLSVPSSLSLSHHCSSLSRHFNDKVNGTCQPGLRCRRTAVMSVARLVLIVYCSPGALMSDVRLFVSRCLTLKLHGAPSVDCAGRGIDWWNYCYEPCCTLLVYASRNFRVSPVGFGLAELHTVVAQLTCLNSTAILFEICGFWYRTFSKVSNQDNS